MKKENIKEIRKAFKKWIKEEIKEISDYSNNVIKIHKDVIRFLLKKYGIDPDILEGSYKQAF